VAEVGSIGGCVPANKDATKVGIPLGSRETLTEAIARRMIQLVTQGEYSPGDRLPSEFELARQFEVGRGAVREALRALSVVGLIRVERGKGTFIRERSDFLVRPILLGFDAAIDPRSLVEARKLIEVELAGRAAERGNSEQIHAIQACLDRMAATMSGPQLEEYLQADVDFHFAIANAAGNDILGQFLTLIRNLMRQWILTSLRDSDAAAMAFRHHQQIFNAIQARRPLAAKKAMAEHLNAMGKKLALPIPPSV
jgi:GntR family transcriptional regulator, transcriptional repressor for pyruvate dehydrogenase complex